MTADPGPIVAACGIAYHPRMWVELLRLVVWMAVIIAVVSLIALLLTQAKL